MKKIFLLIFSLLFCTCVSASTIKEIIIFGDSLSDDGNLHQVLKILPKSPPYYQGRFSNGPTWAEYVSAHFYKKSYVAYSNYAYGGATTILHNPINDSFIAPVILEEEIDGYFAHSILKNKSQALFAIWIGANDYLYERSSDINKLTDDVTKKIAWSITTLISKGGKNFLVLNLPDMAQSPYAKLNGLTERLTLITKLHNQKLADAISDLNKNYADLNIVYLDVYSMFVDVMLDPEKYNQKYGKHITDITHACWGGTILGLDNSLTLKLQAALTGNNTILGQGFNIHMLNEAILNAPPLSQAIMGGNYTRDLEPCMNADEHLFWDDLHPSAVVHEVLGQIVVELLENRKII